MPDYPSEGSTTFAIRWAKFWRFMPKSEPCELPPAALLAKYLHAGAYTDCYFIDVEWPVSHAQYVEAFYSTAVFGIERRLLAWFVAKPSTMAQIHELAAGRLDQFAVWNVESRGTDQLLLSDNQGRTRSWLMTASIGPFGGTGTRLYFGSAVVPVVGRKSGKAKMGFVFRALLGFHKLYSRVLLGAARAQLARQHLA